MLGLSFATTEYGGCHSRQPGDALQIIVSTRCAVQAIAPTALSHHETASVAHADTKFVAEEHSGRPSLAVLSLGCGTTSELPEVNPNAGAWGWAAKGDVTTL
jgi:hypothetical protein